jgi:Stress responsive A/B Barrel Domain
MRVLFQLQERAVWCVPSSPTNPAMVQQCNEALARTCTRNCIDEGDPVIRHIVMWKLKENAEGASRVENVQRLKEKLEDCRDIVPGILKLELGIAAPGLESTYDLVLVADFADKAALDAYQHHPKHEALKGFAAAVREARQCVDYEI